MVELNHKWEEQIKELAKTDIMKAYGETQRIMCKEVCERAQCDERCAFLRRVVGHMLVQAKGL